MDSKEAAELVLDRPTYVHCPLCNGSGMGEMGEISILGYEDAPPNITRPEVLEVHRCELICDHCQGTGYRLSPVYIMACARLEVPVEVPVWEVGRKQYVPRIVLSRVRVVIRSEFVNRSGIPQAFSYRVPRLEDDFHG